MDDHGPAQHFLPFAMFWKKLSYSKWGPCFWTVYNSALKCSAAPWLQNHEAVPLGTLTLTYLLTYSMEQSPSWEANRFSASQKIPRILRNPKVHCRIDNSPPHVPILNQIDTVYVPTYHFSKIHYNIIIFSSLGLPSGLLFSGFLTRTPYAPLLPP